MPALQGTSTDVMIEIRPEFTKKYPRNTFEMWCLVYIIKYSKIILHGYDIIIIWLIFQRKEVVSLMSHQTWAARSGTIWVLRCWLKSGGASRFQEQIRPESQAVNLRAHSRNMPSQESRRSSTEDSQGTSQIKKPGDQETVSWTQQSRLRSC